MKNLRALLSAVLVVVLSACGGPTTQTPPPSGGVQITTPTANARVVTGNTYKVEGTALLGSEVSVAVGNRAPVTATYEPPLDDRLPWSAIVTVGAAGSETIRATATNEEGTSHASVQLRVVEETPYGGWSGIFTIDRRPTGGEFVQGGTMLVWYGSDFFRMYFAGSGSEARGTTDGWDLIDVGGNRITGTFHEAGSIRPDGRVSDKPWVSYRMVLSTGEIIEAQLEADS